MLTVKTHWEASTGQWTTTATTTHKKILGNRISIIFWLIYWFSFRSEVNLLPTSIISMKATKVTRDKETTYKQTFMENEDIFFADAT